MSLRCNKIEPDVFRTLKGPAAFHPDNRLPPNLPKPGWIFPGVVTVEEYVLRSGNLHDLGEVREIEIEGIKYEVLLGLRATEPVRQVLSEIGLGGKYTINPATLAVQGLSQTDLLDAVSALGRAFGIEGLSLPDGDQAMAFVAAFSEPLRDAMYWFWTAYPGVGYVIDSGRPLETDPEKGDNSCGAVILKRKGPLPASSQPGEISVTSLPRRLLVMA